MQTYVVVNARVILGRPCLPSLTDIWKRHDIQFEHHFITMTVTRIAAAYAIGTIVIIFLPVDKRSPF